MGETHKAFTLRRSFGSADSRKVEFLIDSGATYSLVPRTCLNELGVKPHSQVEVALADGTALVRDVGDVFFEYLGECGSAPVIFGEEGEEPLLGALTLEALRLVLNPFRREIYPGRRIRI